MGLGYKEIYKRFQDNITNGKIEPGSKVPSIRDLASELGVAKKTVEAAYDLLVADGYLVSVNRKGNFVNSSFPANTINGISKPTLISSNDLDNKIPNPIFRLGIPALDMFPLKKWSKIVSRLNKNFSALDHPTCKGHPKLRDSLSRYLALSRGVKCTPNQIFITSDYQESMRLIANCLSSQGDKVLMEDPCYFLGREYWRALGLKTKHLPVEEDGINTKLLVRYTDPSILLLTPSHQMPLCMSLSHLKRHEVLEWAKKSKSWVIEDDYDGEFHYSKKQLPTLKRLDTDDRVIYSGTFSKTLFPSLRISYIVVPDALVSRFEKRLWLDTAGVSTFMQLITAEFIDEGHYLKHLKNMRLLYSKRRAYLVEAIERVFPGKFKIELENGGMHLAIRLQSSDEDDKELEEKWRKAGFEVVALSTWYNSSKKISNGLVLSFTNVESVSHAEENLLKIES